MAMVPRPNSSVLNAAERSGSFKKLRYVHLPIRLPMFGVWLIRLTSEAVFHQREIGSFRSPIGCRNHETELPPNTHHLLIARIGARCWRPRRAIHEHRPVGRPPVCNPRVGFEGVIRGGRIYVAPVFIGD